MPLTVLDLEGSWSIPEASLPAALSGIHAAAESQSFLDLEVHGDLS